MGTPGIISGISLKPCFPSIVIFLTVSGLSLLIDHRVALWDVISACSRKGSADARIQSPVFNDLTGFLASFPALRLVALNGTTAGTYYQKLNISSSVPAVVLPSTSPANTRFTLGEKVRCWEIITTSSIP